MVLFHGEVWLLPLLMLLLACLLYSTLLCSARHRTQHHPSYPRADQGKRWLHIRGTHTDSAHPSTTRAPLRTHIHSPTARITASILTFLTYLPTNNSRPVVDQ
ncbi:uncharacterized protein K452DRAFT_117493 [Aplosporella prunicola CBS 121167]|uniref:Secreted protein n=1 Tax=Aplosporella prunicola CBS 121167 TaxID=1176127 RepID=A0A6A6AY36_9PEZI|nr:uncharacterized protein K452DRAFT_117493 [Aplosporella prunicola CBS 121167]KAF2136849.1 hypothetical protein K452DRAFT_117493 [Aplosporella prunicola CBS 121167]